MPEKASKRGTTSAAKRWDGLSADLLKIAGGMSEEVTAKDAHKLRTSIRRLEVAMEAAGKFPGSKKLQKQMNTMRRMAGHIRDIDVQTDLLEGLRGEDYSADCEALHTLMKKRREKREQKTIARVKRELNDGFEDRMREAAKALETTAPMKRPPNTERVEQIRQQYVEFTREVPQDGDPLHDLRKACKRLRYRLEAIPGRESRALEKDLKVVQDAIGAWHDWATLGDEAERRLPPKSIAFVAYLRSLTLAKRHEARRALLTLREKLTHARVGKKPPASVQSVGAAQRRASR